MNLVVPAASSRMTLALEDLARIQRLTISGIRTVLVQMFYDMGMPLPENPNFEDARSQFLELVSTQFDEVLAHISIRSYLESVTNYNDVLWMYNLLRTTPTRYSEICEDQNHTDYSDL